MYRTVLAEEKKLAQFGARSLIVQQKTKQNIDSYPEFKHTDHARDLVVNDEEDKDEGLTLIASIKRKWKECHARDSSNFDGMSRPINAGRQTRAVMNKTLSYSFAFFLTYLFPIIISIRTLSGVDSGPTLSVMARVFPPLQCFFHFVIFIFPKVVHAKNNFQHRGEGSASWCGAFMKVITATEEQQQEGPRTGEITTEQP